MAGERRLVIVGAGYAGLACAGAAAARGLATTVLEARPAPGVGVRTTGILVKEAADAWDVPRRLTRKIHGVRLYSPSLRSLDLERPGYYFLATDTPALEVWWAREVARRGSEIRWGRPFRGGRLRPDGRIELVGHDLTCDVLVGADGTRSSVARDLGLQHNTELLVGIEVETVGVGGMPDDRLHVFLDSRLAPGYIGWAVPGVHGVQIGLAARGSSRPNLAGLLSRLERVFDLSRMEIRGHRAGLIPVGGPLRATTRGNVLLIGDAAGWVSPLTAGGIHCALAWGRRAGVAIADFLLDGGPHPGRVIGRHVPKFTCKRWMRRLIDLRPPNRLIDLALGSRAVRTVARLVFFHHRGLLSRDGWAAWFGRLRAQRVDP